MVLAELAGRIALRLQHGGECDGLVRKADIGARLTDRGHARADRQLAGDEIRPARRAARLGVIVGEHHALVGQLVEVRRLAGHDAAMIGADVEPADVVAHDDKNVGLLIGEMSARERPAPAIASFLFAPERRLPAGAMATETPRRARQGLADKKFA